MHSFAPFSNLNFSVKILRIFRQILTFFAIQFSSVQFKFSSSVLEFFSMILLDFFEILLKFRWNFWKFHGNPLNLQISMNFRGCRDKTRPETRRRPVVLPLRGAEVLVAVRGPSPGEGGGKKFDTILLKYRGLSGAESSKSCRSRQELSNEYFLSNLASIQRRTSPVKFDHLAEKSEKDTVSNLAPKEPA